MGASSPAWQSGPNMSQARIEMNAVILPDGRVLALGGSLNDEDTGSASLNADLLGPDPNNPGKYIFSSAGANAYPRLYHSVALLLPDATVWLAGGNPSTISKVPGVPQPFGVRVKEIAVQREYDCCFVESIMCFDDLAERQPRSFMNVIAIDWFVLMPFGAGKFFQQAAQLPCERRRGGRLSQKSQPCAFSRGFFAHHFIQI